MESLILESVLPFSLDSNTGGCVKIGGMGLNVPVRSLFLSSSLLQGEVSFDVCPDLPVGSIQVILGNDLAGAQMWGDLPSAIHSISMPSTVDVAATVDRNHTSSLGRPPYKGCRKCLG